MTFHTVIFIRCKRNGMIVFENSGVKFEEKHTALLEHSVERSVLVKTGEDLLLSRIAPAIACETNDVEGSFLDVLNHAVIEITGIPYDEV